MKKITLFTLLFITIMSIQLVGALKVEELKINDNLMIDGSISEVLNFKISKNLTEPFRFFLPEGAYNITVNGVAGDYNSTTNLTPSCIVCNFEIKYSLGQTITREDDFHMVYSRTLNIQSNISKLSYSVSLPPSHVVDPNISGSDPSIVPAPTAIRTDGKLITIVWEENNPTLPNIYYIRYQRYNPQSFDLDSFLSEFSEWSVWVIIAITLIIGIIIGTLFGRQFFSKMHIKEIRITKIPASLLNPDEKAVLKLLKEHKGKMNQKDMIKGLSWSKSKVSAVVSNLEYKHIVKREKTGRNYSVELVKEIEDY